MNRLGRAMADPTRSRILLTLLDAPGYPAELARDLELTRTNVSNHLTCLRGCGLIVATPEGRRTRYEIADPHLTQGLRQLLEAVVAGYKSNRGKSKIIVRGHASADEPKPAELAQARAKAVADWLIGAGIPKDRVEIKSYGADAPVERNDDETKASMNRRVDFEAVPEPKPEPKTK